MKRSAILILSTLGPLALAAQPRFVADSELVKLGDVLFQHPREVVFPFTNRGDEPLLITDVHPSCGCVAVRYPGQPIAPGASDTIRATYDARLLGSFYRDIELRTNASPEPLYLAMQGCVVTHLRDFGSEYPIDLGNVRLSANRLDFGDVRQGERPTRQLSLVNGEKTPFRAELMHLPPYITFRCEPSSIPAGQEGTLVLELDTKRMSHMGLHHSSVYLARYLGDKVSDQNEIQLSATLLPPAADLTPEQLASAPRIELSETQLRVGPFEKKDRLTLTVLVSNQGKRPLHIHQLQPTHEALSVSLGNRNVAPGKSTKLKITVSERKLSRSADPLTVLLISNDPLMPKQVVEIEVESTSTP